MQQDLSYSLLISVLYRYRKSFICKRLESYGSLSCYHLLILTIHSCPGTNQEQIAGYLKTDKAVITRGIRKLEGEGYVRREPDAVDKRAYKVYLTERAEALIPEIERAIKEWEDFVSRGVTPEELNATRLCLTKLTENAMSAGRS